MFFFAAQLGCLGDAPGVAGSRSRDQLFDLLDQWLGKMVSFRADLDALATYEIVNNT